MNIFAKIITTSEESIKNEIINTLWLELKEKLNGLEIYSKLDIDSNIVLIYFKNNFEEVVKYTKENFEIVKFFNIWTSLSLDALDINFWDVIVPNTFINKENEVVFLEYLVEKNYDLKNFWLLLNGICLSLENDIVNEEQLNEIIQNYSAEIFDKEGFYIAKTLKENALLETSSIIKIIWKEPKFIKNWVQILEIML
jgi:hypothetical protein